MNAYIITIGDELLIGQVVDTNSAWLGKNLNENGIDVVGRLSVGDGLEEIVKALEYAIQKVDLVLITGGLGPTKDDITKIALAKYFGVEMVFSEATFEKITKFFQLINRPMSDSHRMQCYMPANAELLKNKMGTAPGMLFKKENKIIISMPGVPYEMQAIMNDEVFPLLKSKVDQGFIYHRTVMTAGKGETELEDAIADIINTMPEYIKIAYLPSLGSVRLRLTGRGTDGDEIKLEVDKYCALIANTLGWVVFAQEDIVMEAYLLKLFTSKRLTLSTAESCTGGYLSHRITSVPSSSIYYMGSIISYSNDIKMSMLNVKETTLIKHGAVSEETVIEMVAGALQALKTDVAIAISGIAGPDGGTEEKPVGTMWIAVGNSQKTDTFYVRGTKDRMKNIEYVSNIAMNRLRLFVESHYQD